MEYKRYLKDLEKVEKNGYKVFSCFSCGGGSSMGYKNAGYEIIGTCEIDAQMDRVYQANFPTKYHYVMGVQDFKKIPNEELPNDLFDIDLLDGSPPCSTFSQAGLREKAWGIEKKFKEGQAKQVLSDLFFDYLDVVEKLRPKVVIAENVKGMLKGRAKGYLKMIFQRFEELGYTVQLFLLSGATMGLPQKRERIFFCAHRKEFKLPKLRISFKEKPIYFKDIRDRGIIENPVGGEMNLLLFKYAKYGDTDLSNAYKRYNGKNIGFSHNWLYDSRIPNTLTTHKDDLIVWGENRYLNHRELCLIGSRPLDYKYLNIEPRYLIGMSVPPLMMFKLSNEIKKQRLDLIYNKKEGGENTTEKLGS